MISSPPPMSLLRFYYTLKLLAIFILKYIWMDSERRFVQEGPSQPFLKQRANSSSESSTAYEEADSSSPRQVPSRSVLVMAHSG